MSIDWEEESIYENHSTEWQHLEDLFEERSAILEFDANYDRYQAEQLSAQNMGFENKYLFKKYIQKLKAKGNLI